MYPQNLFLNLKIVDFFSKQIFKKCDKLGVINLDYSCVIFVQETGDYAN